MEQTFRVYAEPGRQDAVNTMISEGWRVVSFSQSATECDRAPYKLVISVLFERELRK